MKVEVGVKRSELLKKRSRTEGRGCIVIIHGGVLVGLGGTDQRSLPPSGREQTLPGFADAGRDADPSRSGVH